MTFKRILPLICLIICLFAMTSVCASDATIASEDTGLELSADNEMEDNLQTNEETPALAAGDNDENVSAETDSEVLTEDLYTYSELRDQIGSGGDKKLTKGTYIYNKYSGDTIRITKAGVIDGNGAVIDMKGFNKQAFVVGLSGVTIKNLTIKNANFDSYGGAIYFENSGTVENCNFINNTAIRGGAVGFLTRGDVKNCNFIDNYAFDIEDYISSDGGAIWMWYGIVENCNFTNNKAKNEGGAIYFQDTGTADTCIFKTSSDTTGHTVIRPPTLNVDNFSTVYGSGEKLTFDLKTYSGIPVTNGNISISVYYKNNDSWVCNYSFLSGEGWTVDLPVGSYYAIFNTEYAGFQPINRTLTITYYVNIVSVTTNNKTVNITAKSNIPQDIIGGKLLFILPNTFPINANYAGNGTWWVLHTFNEYEYGVYEVSASYVGLDDLTIYNAAITITKANSTITLDNVVLDYGDSIKVNVITEGALAITAMIDGEEVGVFKNTIPISGLNAGNHTLTVTTIPDYGHVEVTKTVNITVNKADSTLTVDNVVFDYNGAGSAVVSFTGATGVNASVVGHPDANVNVVGNTITVSNLNAGAYTLGVTTMADVNHNNVTKTADITVNKASTEIILANETLNLIVLDEIMAGATLMPVDAGNLSYASGNESVAIVKDGMIIAVDAGQAVVTVSFVGDDNYAAAENKTITVTVGLDDASVTVDSDTLNLRVDETYKINAHKKPDTILLDITYTSSNNSVVTVDEKGIVTAIAEGTAVITVEIGDDEIYAKNSTNVTVTVSKIPTEIASAAIITAYNVNKNLIITLKDAKGNAISGVGLTVNLNGAKTYATDKNGQVKVSTKGLAPKAYTAKITFNGNTKYDKSTKDVKVTVAKATPKLTAAKKTFKKSVKTKKYTITLKDNSGKVMKNTKVTLKVKGKTYKATTNAKGKATFKIKNLKKKGKFTAKVKFAGNVYYKSVTKKVKITVK